METLNLTLDTEPLARSLDKVSGHVTLTTGAVSAMELAVIQAEKESADNICRNVDRGFYNLIRSQVSSKLATYLTSMNASFMLLMQYSKTLSTTQNRMETDINRLKRQYYKIFHSLDRSLENRVGQLDKDAVRLSHCSKTLITDRKRKNVSSTILSHQDSENLTKTLTTARLKEKAGTALMSIYAKLSGDSQYASKVSGLLNNISVSGKEPLFVPVVCVSEQSQVTAESSFSRLYCPDYLDSRTCSALEGRVSEYLPQVFENCSDLSYHSDVSSAYMKMVNDLNTDPRVKQMMISLYESRRAQ